MRILPILMLFLFAELLAQEPGDADKRKDLLGPVQVSRVNSIDEVKGAYKSPRRAMFMSLVVPGSGQMYVGSKQSRYVRGAFYLAEEIALISGLYYHSVYKYDKQVSKYQKFANTYFSVMRYEEKMAEIYSDYYDTLFQTAYGAERENYCKAIYGPSIGNENNCVPFSSGLDFAKNYDGTHYDQAAYYRSIASENLIMGWDDAVYAEGKTPEEIMNLLFDRKYITPIGESDYYNSYMSMRKKANSYADRQAFFVGALILNHIVSAIDAALSAKAHNNSLYEERVSFLDKIRLGSDLHLGETFRAGAGLWYSF
jgi:hypothetical protein